MNNSYMAGHKIQRERLQRLYSKQMIPQCLLFSGIPGIGKKLAAMNFLEMLFCSSENPPCGQCPSCIQIRKKSFPDVIELLPDEKGSIPIGEKDQPGSVRWLIDRLSRRSVSGQYGILIDGVEKISVQGQNALLKLIEEPPSGTHIILITSGRSRVLSTILSRSMEVPFYPLSESEVVEVLRMKDVDFDDIEPVAAISGGSVETASLLCDKEILGDVLGLAYEISAHVNTGDRFVGEMSSLQKKMGLETLLSCLVNLYRHILRSHIREMELHRVFHKADIRDDDIILKIIRIMTECMKGMANNLNPRFALKSMLLSVHSEEAGKIP